MSTTWRGLVLLFAMSFVAWGIAGCGGDTTTADDGGTSDVPEASDDGGADADGDAADADADGRGDAEADVEADVEADLADGPDADADACTPDCTGRECGDDGCGLTCGPGCGTGYTCSAAGTCECPSAVECGGSCCIAGQECDVGGGCCTPVTTCPAPDDCGTIANGCGGTVRCGAGCSTPQTCGGGGTPNVCGTPAPSIGDVAVDVGNDLLYKLWGASGSIGWGPVPRPNCGGIAVDPLDFGVYTGSTSHCGGGAGVFKFDTTGALVWNNTGSMFCGGCGGYYIGNGGIAVDVASSTPGVLFTETGCYGNIGKVSRANGAQLWCNGTNDLGRPSVDPTHNGQSYAITIAGAAYNYNTLYSNTATGAQTSASSCEGFTEVNPADGTLYKGGDMAANGCGLVLYQVSTTSLGATVWSMNLSAYVSSFDGLAVQPWSGGYLYVLSYTSSSIVVVDPATRSVVRSFATVVPSTTIAVNPSGGNLYLASSAGDFVYAYSPTGTLVWTSPDLGGPVYNIAAPRNVVGGP